MTPSTKEQIVRAAERLFAAHGLDGISLRQIGAAAGNGNNSAVQYHFGSRDQLVQAIFEYRLPWLHERRTLLIAEHRPDDLRSLLDCQVRTLLEHSELPGSHYLCFVDMLRQYGRSDVFEGLPAALRDSAREFQERLGGFLPHLVEPLRARRVAQAMAFIVTAAADLEAARDLALARFGRVDVVMNNVGILAVGAVEDIPLEAWQRVIDVNLLGVVRSNLVFLPLLLAQGSGHVVNTASTAGLLPYGFDRLPYTATKHAVVGLSESLALYLRPRGIGVTCLCPAGVATNIIENVTFFGEPKPPRGPRFPVLDADPVGEIVADAIETGRFLALTAPETADDLRERAADIEAYLDRIVGEQG
nr:SDR family NAD(P)-dependent oxidoreductase [Frankia sp. Mgl5]